MSTRTALVYDMNAASFDDTDFVDAAHNPDHADGRDDHHGDGFDWPEQQCEKRQLGGCVCKSLCDWTCQFCGEPVV